MFQVGARVRIIHYKGVIDSFVGATGVIVSRWDGVGWSMVPDPEYAHIMAGSSWSIYESRLELIDDPNMGAYMELFI